MAARVVFEITGWITYANAAARDAVAATQRESLGEQETGEAFKALEVVAGNDHVVSESEARLYAEAAKNYRASLWGPARWALDNGLMPPGAALVGEVRRAQQLARAAFDKACPVRPGAVQTALVAPPAAPAPNRQSPDAIACRIYCDGRPTANVDNVAASLHSLVEVSQFADFKIARYPTRPEFQPERPLDTGYEGNRFQHGVFVDAVLRRQGYETRMAVVDGGDRSDGLGTSRAGAWLIAVRVGDRWNVFQDDAPSYMELNANTAQDALLAAMRANVVGTPTAYRYTQGPVSQGARPFATIEIIEPPSHLRNDRPIPGLEQWRRVTTIRRDADSTVRVCPGAGPSDAGV